MLPKSLCIEMDWGQRICFPLWVCLKMSPATCPLELLVPNCLVWQAFWHHGRHSLAQNKPMGKGPPNRVDRIILIKKYQKVQTQVFLIILFPTAEEKNLFPTLLGDVNRGEKQRERRDLTVILTSRSNPFDFRIIFRSSLAALDA